MGPARLELDADIVALLEAQDRPIHEAARELIVLELYREGQLSGGRAAEILRALSMTLRHQGSSN